MVLCSVDGTGFKNEKALPVSLYSVRAKSCTRNADCAACLLADASHGACKEHKAASQLQSDTLPDWRRHTFLFRTLSLQRLSAQAVPLSSRDS